MKKRLYSLVIIFCLASSAQAQDKSLLVLGDSISAAYGVALNQGWVYLLQRRLSDLGYRYTVNNASISGDTTRSARARLANVLRQQPADISIIELGGNDGLRGLSLEQMSANLTTIINELLLRDNKILLIPMRLPPNYGQVYNDRFAAVYMGLAQKYDIVLTEFILQGIADNAELMQSDGIHPRAEAQQMMLDTVWASLQPLLETD